MERFHLTKWGFYYSGTPGQLTLTQSDCRGTGTSWLSIQPPSISLSSLHHPSSLLCVALMRAASHHLAVSVWNACLHHSSFGAQGGQTATSSNQFTEFCSALLRRHAASVRVLSRCALTSVFLQSRWRTSNLTRMLSRTWWRKTSSSVCMLRRIPKAGTQKKKLFLDSICLRKLMRIGVFGLSLGKGHQRDWGGKLQGLKKGDETLKWGETES